MPNPSEMMRDLTEDAHRRHATARTYRDNLSLSKGTRELAGRLMRSLEADFPELADTTPVAKRDEEVRHYSRRNSIGGTQVLAHYHDGSEACVATFGNDHGGQTAYRLFTAGLADSSRFSLFDYDAGKWLVGSLDQLID